MFICSQIIRQIIKCNKNWHLLFCNVESGVALKQKTSITAGKGDPYWYEWTMGLLKVVEMLQPESGIESVSFQVTGAKGWDDVAVRYSDGRNEFFQIKHSRVGKNITFGDLVGTDDQGSSLLNGLFAAWKAMKLKPEESRC